MRDRRRRLTQSSRTRSNMRMRKWLVGVLLAGCVPSNNPPPQYGYQGQGGYQQPPPQPQPQPDPYQPPPQPQPQPQPQPLPPQPMPAYQPPVGPVYVDISTDIIGSDVPAIEVFYDQLQPYGSWYDDSTYGWVF